MHNLVAHIVVSSDDALILLSQGGDPEAAAPGLTTAPDGGDIVLMRCELDSLQASARGPIPPELLLATGKKSAQKRIAELKRLLATKMGDLLAGAPEAQPLHSPAFRALVIAVAHHEVRTKLSCVLCSLFCLGTKRVCRF